MTEQEQQEKFAENVGLLLVWLRISKYKFTLEAIKNSLSIVIDISKGAYEPAGKYWEALGMRWNGFRTFSYGEKKNAS